MASKILTEPGNPLNLMHGGFVFESSQGILQNWDSIHCVYKLSAFPLARTNSNEFIINAAEDLTFQMTDPEIKAALPMLHIQSFLMFTIKNNSFENPLCRHLYISRIVSLEYLPRSQIFQLNSCL